MTVGGELRVDGDDALEDVNVCEDAFPALGTEFREVEFDDFGVNAVDDDANRGDDLLK